MGVCCSLGVVNLDVTGMFVVYDMCKLVFSFTVSNLMFFFYAIQGLQTNSKCVN